MRNNTKRLIACLSIVAMIFTMVNVPMISYASVPGIENMTAPITFDNFTGNYCTVNTTVDSENNVGEITADKTEATVLSGSIATTDMFKISIDVMFPTLTKTQKDLINFRTNVHYDSTSFWHGFCVDGNGKLKIGLNQWWNEAAELSENKWYNIVCYLNPEAKEASFIVTEKYGTGVQKAVVTDNQATNNNVKDVTKYENFQIIKTEGAVTSTVYMDNISFGGITNFENAFKGVTDAADRVNLIGQYANTGLLTMPDYYNAYTNVQKEAFAASLPSSVFSSFSLFKNFMNLETLAKSFDFESGLDNFYNNSTDKYAELVSADGRNYCSVTASGPNTSANDFNITSTISKYAFDFKINAVPTSDLTFRLQMTNPTTSYEWVNLAVVRANTAELVIPETGNWGETIVTITPGDWYSMEIYVDTTTAKEYLRVKNKNGAYSSRRAVNGYINNHISKGITGSKTFQIAGGIESYPLGLDNLEMYSVADFAATMGSVLATADKQAFLEKYDAVGMIELPGYYDVLSDVQKISFVSGIDDSAYASTSDFATYISTYEFDRGDFDFDLNTVRTLSKYNFENGSEGFVPNVGTLTTVPNPEASTATVLEITPQNLSAAKAFTLDISSNPYVVITFDIMKKVTIEDSAIKAKLGTDTFFEISGGKITNKNRAADNFANTANNKWHTVKLVANTDTNEIDVYLKNDYDYVRIYTKKLSDVDVSNLKFEVPSNSCDAVYVDNLILESYEDFDYNISAAASTAEVAGIVNAYADIKVIDTFENYKYLAKADKTAMANEILALSTKNLSAVQKVVDKYAVADALDGVSDELAVVEADWSGSTLNELACVINKNITAASAKLIVASYADGILKDVAVVDTGAVAQNSIVKYAPENGIAISDIGDVRLFLFADMSTIKPLTNSGIVVDDDITSLGDLTITYPNGSMKSITFSIDDGVYSPDLKFLNIVRSAGIKGTFNLVGTNVKSNLDRSYYNAEGLREMYEGYGIANHGYYHTRLLNASEASDSKYVQLEGAPDGVYKDSSVSGEYYYSTLEAYKNDIKNNDEYLENFFGKGSVVSYAWPFGIQDSKDDFEVVNTYVKTVCDGARRSIENDDTFLAPADWYNWGYNVNHKNLLTKAETFAKLNAGNTLRMFAIGVHSNDYENNSKWGDLEEFAMLYGNNPEEYWYASVDDIREYIEASKSLTFTDGVITNNSSYDIYAKLNGKSIRIPAFSSYGKAE